MEPPSEQTGPVKPIVGYSKQDSLQLALAAPELKKTKVVCVGKDSENGVFDLISTIVSHGKSQEDPFFVLDVGVVLSLWERWVTNLPMFQPFYAVKCNPNRYLLAVLAALGAGFDCASRAEIAAILDVGVPADRIIYANPCKAEGHLKYAAEVDVNLTTFDSMAEVHKLKSIHPSTAAVIRIAPPVDAAARYPLRAKFGAMPEEVRPLLEAAIEAGLKVVGVSFHIGSCPTYVGAYRDAIGASKGVFELAEQLGMPPMTVLDVGGGFTTANLEDAALVIREGVRDYFPDYHEKKLTLMAEPGRLFSETAFTLAASVIGKRVRGELREYWINDGFYGSLNRSRLEEGVVAKAICLPGSRSKEDDKGEDGETYASRVFGPTLDEYDVVLKDCLLPELETKDWLVFPAMGAYTNCIATCFNGFSGPDIRSELAYSC